MNNSDYPMVLGQGERQGYYAYVLDWNSCCVKLRAPTDRFTFFYDEWYSWDEAMELYNFEGGGAVMTNFERAESDILVETKLTKRYAENMELGGIWTTEQAGEYLNKKLVELQKRWFELHRKLVEG